MLAEIVLRHCRAPTARRVAPNLFFSFPCKKHRFHLDKGNPPHPPRLWDHSMSHYVYICENEKMGPKLA